MRFLEGLSVVLLCAIGQAAWPARASTVGLECRANYQDLLPNDADKREPAIVLSACGFDQSGKSIVVVAIGFDGPSDGWLTLTAARPSVKPLRIGRPLSLDLQMLDNGNAIAVVKAVTGSGTGVKEERFHVFAVGGAAIRELWSGIAYKGDFSPSGSGLAKFGAISVTEDVVRRLLNLDHFLVERRYKKGGREIHGTHVPVSHSSTSFEMP